MKIQRFEDIIAWQKSQDLAVTIYSLFKEQRDYGFKNQILRAVISISNNIAEGFERSTDKDFNRFLHIAMGSCSEVKSMLYLAVKIQYLEYTEATKLINQCNEISKIIRGFMKSICK